MFWPNTHARSRKRLSTYIGGRLSPRERTELEAHLAGCEACRAELAELRATISAVSGLADAEAPRSFAVTPRMLEQRAAAPPAPLPPLATGMRLAGAGVALVLAVVLVGDFASMGDGGSGTDGGGMRQAAEFQMMSDSDSGDTAGGGGAPAPAATGTAEDNAAIGAERASPEDFATSTDKAEACAPTAAGGGVGGPATATQEAEPTPEPTLPAASVESLEPVDEAVECAPAAANVTPEQASPAAAEALPDSDEGEFAAAPEPSPADDGGVSALTLIEIILGAGLVALAGGIGIEYLRRRRTA